MKEEKGVTLISLIVYIILTTVVIAGVSLITSSFYKNVRQFDNESESVVAYSKVNMFFLRDIKREGVQIDAYQNNYIILSYEKDLETLYVQYSIQNGALYRDRVKICDDIQDSRITVNTSDNTIEVYLKIGNYEKTTTYVIEN